MLQDISLCFTNYNTAALGTAEKTAVLENGGKGVIYNQEKTHSGLANQRRYPNRRSTVLIIKYI